MLKGPNVSLNRESEHDPRNESNLSIFGALFFRSVRELTLMNDFDDVTILLLPMINLKAGIKNLKEKIEKLTYFELLTSDSSS